tara:strand:+ start:2414 stop:2722 length:309 start_codon:yes stop_codon:yes gene_type:complete
MGKKKKKNTSNTELISFENFEQELEKSLPTIDQPVENKQLLGDRIYKLVEARFPAYAGKLTGMILELDRHQLDKIMKDHEVFEMCINAAYEQLLIHLDIYTE